MSAGKSIAGGAIAGLGRGEGMNDKYPRGKLNADDEGELQMRIGIQDKTIILDFGKQVVWIGLDYYTAMAMADKITKAAEKIKPKG